MYLIPKKPKFSELDCNILRFRDSDCADRNLRILLFYFHQIPISAGISFLVIFIH